MLLLRLRSRLHSRLTWLLCLALLLPLAQSVSLTHGMTHGLSHGLSPGSGRGLTQGLTSTVSARALSGNSAVGQEEAPARAHCDLCLFAAALGAAAPTADPAPTPSFAGLSAAPLWLATFTLAAAPTLAYRSRAPPSFLR